MFRNKWNGKVYDVQEMNEKEVVLIREEDHAKGKSGTTVTISKSEFFSSYYEIENRKQLT